METETKTTTSAVEPADLEKQARNKRIDEDVTRALNAKIAEAENAEGAIFSLPLAKCFVCGDEIDHCGERYIIAAPGADHPSEVCDFCALNHGYQEWPKWLPRLVVP